MKRASLYKIILSSLLVWGSVAVYSFAAEISNRSEASISDDHKSLFDLESHWDLGNVAVLVRHTERCDKSDNACLSGEAGITVVGAEQAIQLKNSYNKLITDETTIYNSPIKRTEQTADIMFGDKSVDKRALRENCKKDIYQDIVDLKEQGKNLVLVTHSTCIDNLGESHQDKLFEFDVHDKDTYGGSFFLSVDSDKKEVYPLGYLSSDEMEKFLEYIE